MGEGTKGCVAGTDADRHYAPHGQFPLPIAQLLLQSCGERGKCLLLEVHAGPEAGPWHGLCWARCRLGAGGLPRHISKIVCLTKRVKRRAGFRSAPGDRKSTRLNSSHVSISYAVFCLKKKTKYVYASYDVTST